MTRDECCPPAAPERSNKPGQPALRYRTGTWATFRAAMIARLPGQTVPPERRGEPARRPLAQLTARDPSEPTIALVDAAACVLDVLTFYQERQLNEGFLGTATERISLAQIARALGYEPAPGQAASGWLAFTTSTLATEPVAVPVGTAVMALPEGSAPPPVFETIEAIDARREWNALPVARRLPLVDLQTGTGSIWVDGVETRARPGDGLLLYGTDRLSQPGSERWDFRRVTAIEVAASHQQTRLVFDRGLGDTVTSPPEQVEAVLIFRARASVFGHNAPDWKTQSDQTQLTAWWTVAGSMQDVPVTGSNGRTRLLSAPSPVTEWPRFALSEDPAVAAGLLDLDREYPGIVPDSWVVLVDAYHVEAYEVTQASPGARADFTLTSKVTRLKLRGEHLTRFDRRATSVSCEPDAFTRVGDPDTRPVQGASVVLAGAFPSLIGRMLAVYGVDADDGSPRGEVARVVSATVGGDGTTTLTLDPPLAFAYGRDTVVLNANVAQATHGQTAADEVLGSGNAAQAFQSFVLKGKPLTHVPSPNGSESTLTLRVGGVEWDEVPFLYGQLPDARVYRLRHAADGSTVVEFGDGTSGARLPTGQENVVASYRTGLGLAGEVKARRASLLARRPVGIDMAINPAAFGGAADPDGAEQIRTYAPRTVLTLDRLVSIQDYEDFARAFDGVGKALAAGLWAGQRRLVHLTVASASGLPLGSTDPVVVNLAAALRKYQDPVHQVVVASYQARAFGVKASLLVDPARAWEAAQAAARAALISAFDFAHREFGQSVAPAEVVAVLQAVEGVVAVDLDRIWRTDDPSVAAPPHVLLQARGPQSSGGARQTAELLRASTNPTDVVLERMPP